MIEISFGKLILLALVALIVLGPEKLPHAARTAGALVRRLRSGWESVRTEVERELEIEELKRTAKETATRAQSMQSQMNNTARAARDQVGDAVNAMREGVTQTQKDFSQRTDTSKETPHGNP